MICIKCVEVRSDHKWSQETHPGPILIPGVNWALELSSSHSVQDPQCSFLCSSAHSGSCKQFTNSLNMTSHKVIMTNISGEVLHVSLCLCWRPPSARTSALFAPLTVSFTTKTSTTKTPQPWQFHSHSSFFLCSACGAKLPNSRGQRSFI